MYLDLMKKVREALAAHIRGAYGVELAIVLERPPKLEMGEAASPVSFELAKRLKRAPRQLAQEIAAGIGKIPGVARLEVAGAGYLNAYFDRGEFWKSLQQERKLFPQGLKPPVRPVDDVGPEGPTPKGETQGAQSKNTEGTEKNEKVIVEHTSINPNKAAHIGHLRNAVLGDTMARVLRSVGERVQVQNYIDNTGVQVADVVIGLLRLRNLGLQGVRALVGGVRAPVGPARFDYYCWDLYAEATQFFAEDKARAAKLRGETLRAIEEGRGEEAEVAEVVADAIVSLHLRTMARLGIEYQLLARESEILHLKFWDAAFEKLKASGAIEYVTSGKMAGCWVMRQQDGKEREEVEEVKEKAKSATQSALRKSTEGTETAEGKETNPQGLKPRTAATTSVGPKGPPPNTAETSEDIGTLPSSGQADSEEISQDKIIVRSNGTVTYVGKDIAYQLWKFGLLGKDFAYRRWPDAPQGEDVWATTSESGEANAPHFGEAAEIVYNVIDTRQSYLQGVVAEGLRRLGHPQEADRSIHLSYDVVALTPRCARELGYELSADEAKKPYVEVSGRKGLGVKADDLIDKLEAATLAEVKKRHPAQRPAVPDLPEQGTVEQHQIAHAIAAGALRFFLLKFTRNTIIAFDFDDALNFEGETGPYCQYAVVRARSIWRKGAEQNPDMLNDAVIRDAAALARIMKNPELSLKFLDGSENNDLWGLLLLAGSLDYAVDAAIGAQEPAFLAKHAFQLAQAFNNFYHRHHILSEADEQKRAFLLGLTEIVETQLVKTLELLGIEAPEKM